jgi:exopolysaccharide biosynthesis polyprenyl glycosylphosphotransferase
MTSVGGHERPAKPPQSFDQWLEEAAPGAIGARLRDEEAEGLPRWWRDALRRRMLALADVGAGACASLVAALSSGGSPWAFATLPLWVLYAKLFGLYDRDQREIRHLTIDELSPMAGWALCGVATMALVVSLATPRSLTGWIAALAWAVAIVSACGLRSAARWLWRRVTPPEVTFVLGDGELADATRRKLELFHDMHLSLAGGEDGALRISPDGPGEGERLAARVDRIVVAAHDIDPELIASLAVTCRQRQVKLSVVSPLRGRAGPALRLSQVADLPVFEYDTWDVSRSTMLLKRIFDVGVSAVALAVLAPLVPVITLAIALDSRGRPLFSQLRAGMGGRPFRMYKFRTMACDAEERLADVVSLDDLREPVFKVKDDPRVTRVGRFLRRFSLDELPQLLNVLKGDMSMVGPRPEQLEVVHRYAPEHMFRLAVKPGMTGPMQVFGRGELTFSERLAVELDYIDHVSLGRDLRILLLTVPAAFRGTGAY